MSVRFVINPVEFANNASAHRGNIALHDLTRLQDALSNDEGTLNYQISGHIDSNDKPYLVLKIDGFMNLICQRCLGGMPYELAIKNQFYLTKNNNELDQINEDHNVDAILAVPELDVIDLIEEEIILGLPISPRHNDNLCEPDQSGSDDSTTNKVSQPKNPFAALAVLKKTN